MAAPLDAGTSTLDPVGVGWEEVLAVPAAESGPAGTAGVVETELEPVVEVALVEVVELELVVPAAVVGVAEVVCDCSAGPAAGAGAGADDALPASAAGVAAADGLCAVVTERSADCVVDDD